jgi:hypothetical protein
MFDKQKDFLSKHRYEKIASIVRTLSLIRQDMQKIYNRLDVSLHYPDAQSLLWKLRAAEVQPSGRG